MFVVVIVLEYLQLYQRTLKKTNGKIYHYYMMENLSSAKTSILPRVTCGFSAPENKISTGVLVEIHKLIFSFIW